MAYTKKRSVWAWGIFIFYLSFVILFSGLAIYSSHLGFQYVTPDYYKKSVVYQEHITAQNRARQLAESPSLVYKAKQEEIQLRMPFKFTEGNIVFYRPNDKTKDRQQKVALKREQTFSIKDLVQGKWKIQLSWKSSGKSYYHEQEIYIKN